MEKRKGTITIGKLKSKEMPFDVCFWGFNEGCSCGCKDENEVKKEVDNILTSYKDYKIIIKDEREREVNKWF